jgi:endo-1,4-beta-xylanase
MTEMSRRSFLRGAAAAICAGGSLTQAQNAPDTSALTRAARQSGKILGVYTGAHELLLEPAASAIIAQTFSLIAVGNDLKFSNRLRPTPDSYNFTYGDQDVTWAQQHNLLFRGHCLVWWNALPDWFKSYVTPANAKQVMTDHINRVVTHYAGRVYSWDVVNEAIYHDNRPDGLRRKPWLDLIGPDYIDIAFQTAAAADPKARLILNECYIEHATPAEVSRRAQLLALATRLKKSGVPVSALGLQSHLRGNTPIDHAGMTTFMKQVHDLGLDMIITELDVDDVDVPGPLIAQTVAAKYAEYLNLVLPFVKIITFEGLRNDPAIPKRPDGLAHKPNLFDEDYSKNAAYDAVVASLRTPGGSR